MFVIIDSLLRISNVLVVVILDAVTSSAGVLAEGVLEARAPRALPEGGVLPVSWWPQSCWRGYFATELSELGGKLLVVPRVEKELGLRRTSRALLGSGCVPLRS